MARGIPSLTSALTSSAITLSRAASMAAMTSSMAECTLAAGAPVSATGSSGSSGGLTSLALAAFPSLDSLGMGLLTIINVLPHSYSFASRGKRLFELRWVPYSARIEGQVSRCLRVQRELGSLIVHTNDYTIP